MGNIEVSKNSIFVFDETTYGFSSRSCSDLEIRDWKQTELQLCNSAPVYHLILMKYALVCS